MIVIENNGNKFYRESINWDLCLIIDFSTPILVREVCGNVVFEGLLDDYGFMEVVNGLISR
jgi:hypothetical protein